MGAIDNMVDMHGNLPKFLPGESVICYGKHRGVVVKQRQSYDGPGIDWFWGMVEVKDEDGEIHVVHNWQCRHETERN